MFRKLSLLQVFLLSLQLTFAQDVEMFPDLVVKGQPIINAIAESSDGGYFLATTIDRVNGIKTSSLTKIDASGNPVEGFDAGILNNRIYHMKELSDGKILIAGTFNRINGESSGMLLRLNSDGSIDDTFTPFTAGTYALSFVVQQSGKIVVCGNFTTGAYSKFARLNANGTVDNTFTAMPSHGNPFMQVMIDSNDNMYLNGISKIFKTDVNGVQLAGFPISAPSGGAFYNIQSFGDKIVVGGYFTSIGGETRKNLAVVNEDGSIGAFSTLYATSNGKCAVKTDGTIILDQETSTRVFYSDGSLGPIPTTGYTQKVFVDSQQRLLVTAQDLAVSGVSKPNIVRFNSDYTVDNTFQCSVSFTVGIDAIAVYPDGKMLIGGSKGVKGIGSTSYRLARINTDGTQDLSFTPDLADDAIVSLALQDEKILVCAKQSLRRLNSTGSIDNTFEQKTLSSWDNFTKVKQHNSKIYVAGVFSTVNGKLSPGIVRLNENGTIDNTFSSPFSFAYITDFTFQSDGKIVLVGSQSDDDSGFQADVARLNSNGSIDESFTSGTKSGNGIYAVAIDSEDRIYFAGDFTNYANTGISRFAKLSADGVHDTSFNPSLPFGYSERIVTLIVADDNEIIAGVNFFPYEMTRTVWAPKVLAAVDSNGTVLTKSWDDFGMNASINAAYFDGYAVYLTGRIVAEDNSAFSPIGKILVNEVSGSITNLIARRTNLTQVMLSWDNNISKAEELVIERSIGTADAFSELTRLDAADTMFTDTDDIDASVTYFYRIKAVNPVSESDYSPIAETSPVLIVNAATDIDTVSFSISWNELTIAENYKVELSDDNFATSSTIITSDNVITVSDLEPFTQYRLIVSYLDGGIYYPATDTITVTTLPRSPVITGATALSRRVIEIEWVNRFVNATDISIYRSLSNSSGYQKIADVSADVTTYRDSTLSGSKIYYYKLKASTHDIASPYSNVASDTTDALLTQTVTFEPLADLTYADTTLLLSATASSGLHVTFTSSNDSIVWIYGDTLAVLRAGVVTITATQLGNEDYEPALQERTLTIVKANQTLLFNPTDTVEFSVNVDLALVATASSGLQVNFESDNNNVVEIIENKGIMKGAGTVTIKAVQSGNESYNSVMQERIIVITKADQTITFDSLSATYTKADGDIALQANATSGLAITFVSSDPTIVSIENNTGVIHKTGTVTITATQSGNENFNAAQSIEQVIEILPALQTISFELSGKTFGDPSFELNATASSGLPIVYSSANPAIASIDGNVVTILSAGTVVITASQNGDDNFEPAEASANLVIAKASQTITFTLIEEIDILGIQTITLEATASSGLPVVYTSSNKSIVKINENILTIIHPGNVTITASQNGNDNYEPAVPVARVLRVRLITATDMMGGNAIDVYPNPSTGVFTIKAPACSDRFTILNIGGTIVKTGDVEGTDNLSLDLSDADSGVYYVIIEGCKTPIAFEVIKK